MFIAKQNNKVFKAQNVWLEISGVFFVAILLFFLDKKSVQQFIILLDALKIL